MNVGVDAVPDFVRSFFASKTFFARALSCEQQIKKRSSGLREALRDLPLGLGYECSFWGLPETR
eukprot:scaffold207412_cov47-Attheya_sp.AAC.1